MKKHVVYIDMDGVLADFWGGVGRPKARPDETSPPEMFNPGFFLNLPVNPGAREAVTELLKRDYLDLYIATLHSYKNPYSASEKIQWISIHFPELINKMFLTCDKGHLNGDYLIDDDRAKWGHKFKGTFIHMQEHNPEESWKYAVERLKYENL